MSIKCPWQTYWLMLQHSFRFFHGHSGYNQIFIGSHPDSCLNADGIKIMLLTKLETFDWGNKLKKTRLIIPCELMEISRFVSINSGISFVCQVKFYFENCHVT